MALGTENADMKTDVQKIINDTNGASESSSFNIDEKLVQKNEFPIETISRYYSFSLVTFLYSLTSVSNTGVPFEMHPD